MLTSPKFHPQVQATVVPNRCWLDTFASGPTGVVRIRIWWPLTWGLLAGQVHQDLRGDHQRARRALRAP